MHLSHARIRQGGTVRVSLAAPAGLSRVRVRFAGRTWPLYPEGQGLWQTVIGTDPTTSPGHHTVAVDALTAGGTPVVLRRTVTVARVEFARRRLTFDQTQAALLTQEAAERERRRVREALRVLHPRQLWEDPMARPVDGHVTSPYGVLSIYQGQVRGFHGGVDIAAAEGELVRSAGDGIVRLAEPLPISGNAVLVDHGLGVVTSYLHLSQIDVRTGQRVRKGQVIGRVGSTGLATGPHLHWGVRVNGVRVDPMLWTAR
jgi:murein DD-endopeptidase MepM/ murein hydrolase activator NlpD